MFQFGFNISKCKVQIQLCLGRIKLQRNKKTIAIKAQRKDVAELLAAGKQESARIRVEGVIRENLMMQAFEILELYMELLNVRVQLIDKTKEIPRDMIEAISSVIYAAQRVADLPELSALRTMFASKYGKEYATEASNDVTCAKWQVNHNLMRCLLLEPPPPEEKLATLSDIGQEHGIEWDMAAAARDLNIMTPGSAVPPPPSEPSIAGGGATDPSFQAPGGPGGPGGSSYPVVGGGGGGYPMHPTGQSPFGPGQPQFTDANQAAAYANQAAQQAKVAADYAAQFAMAQSGLPLPDPQAGSTSGVVSPHGWATPPPLSGSQPTGHLPPVRSATDDPSTAWGQPVAAAASASATQRTSAGGYLVKSEEELQRAYDEALGPPGKTKAPETVVVSPPSAPPAAPPRQPSQGGEPSQGGAEPSGGPVNDYAELTARLEALKRG